MPAYTTNSVYGIIKDAMSDAGYLRQGSNPNSTQLADYAIRLTDIINYWQTCGIKLFLHQEILCPLVAGQGTYRFSPTGDVAMAKPLEVLQANVVTLDGIRRPLVSLAWQEWMTLSQIVGNDSTISSYFVDKQTTELIVHFWNTPDATDALNTAQMLMRVQANNPWNLEESVQFPQEWRMALRWALADEICTGQPAAIMQRCAQKAALYKEELENWDVENSPTTFAMDSRSSYLVGGFS